MFNFILAFVLSVIIVAWVGYDLPVVGRFTENSAAQEAGMQEGDVITKINGKRMHIFREIAVYNQFHQGETMHVEYERDGKSHEVTIQPGKDEAAAI